MNDTKQVTGVVQSVTEATSIKGTYWKVALPPPPGLKFPEVYNITKPEWMEGVKAGVVVALDVKRGRARKPEPQYESDYYQDVQSVKVLKVGGPSGTGQSEPWPGDEPPKKPPTEAPKKPVDYMASDAKDRLIMREVALKAAMEFVGHGYYNENETDEAVDAVIEVAEKFNRWLGG